MTITVCAPLDLDVVADLLHDPVPPEVRAVGGGTPIAHLVRGLVGRGRHVTVVTGDIGRREEVVLEGTGLRVHLGPYREHHRARDAFAAERDYVTGTVRRSGAAVVHAHWTYEFALGALAAAPDAIVTVHDWAPTILRYYPDPYRAVRFGMNAVTLARARHLTVPSPTMQRRLRRWARASATVVPNAIDDGGFAPRDHVAERRIRDVAPRALSINNGFGRLKNTTTLLRAWPAVRGRRPGARLALVGREYEPAGAAARWAAEHGLDDGVDFVGPLPNAEVMRRLADADVLVHPSREESFGLVLLEAMARGTAVVGGARSGAVPWVLDGGRAGLLCDVRDAADLAAAVVRTLSDADATHRRVLHAHDRAWRHFRSTTALDAYEACYRERGWRP